MFDELQCMPTLPIDFFSIESSLIKRFLFLSEGIKVTLVYPNVTKLYESSGRRVVSKSKGGAFGGDSKL